MGNQCKFTAFMCALCLLTAAMLCMAQSSKPIEPQRENTPDNKMKSVIATTTDKSDNIVVFDKSKLTVEERNFLEEKDKIETSDLNEKEKAEKTAALKEKLRNKK